MKPFIQRDGSYWKIYFPGEQLVFGIMSFRRACAIAKMFGSEWWDIGDAGVPYRELFN